MKVVWPNHALDPSLASVAPGYHLIGEQGLTAGGRIEINEEGKQIWFIFLNL